MRKKSQASSRYSWNQSDGAIWVHDWIVNKILGDFWTFFDPMPLIIRACVDLLVRQIMPQHHAATTETNPMGFQIWGFRYVVHKSTTYRSKWNLNISAFVPIQRKMLQMYIHMHKTDWDVLRLPWASVAGPRAKSFKRSYNELNNMVTMIWSIGSGCPLSIKGVVWGRDRKTVSSPRKLFESQNTYVFGCISKSF